MKKALVHALVLVVVVGGVVAQTVTRRDVLYIPKYWTSGPAAIGTEVIHILLRNGYMPTEKSDWFVIAERPLPPTPLAQSRTLHARIVGAGDSLYVFTHTREVRDSGRTIEREPEESDVAPLLHLLDAGLNTPSSKPDR